MIIHKSTPGGSSSFNLIFSHYFFLLLFCSLTGFSQVGIVSDRLRNDLINENVNDTEIAGYLDSMNADGSWNDINYANASGAPNTSHSRRLKLICIAYNKPSSVHFHKMDVKEKIRLSTDFYVRSKPKASGWWQNAIGAPVNFGPALLLMKTGDTFGFDQAQLDDYAGELNYYTESGIMWPPETTGANKTWLLTSSVYKACIKNDEAVLSSNFRNAFEEARIIEGPGEGIKRDYSLFQHGPQLYNGGYGRNFILDITYFATLAHGTTYQMTDAGLRLITDCVLEGYQLFCQNSSFDFQSVGRELVRPDGLSAEAMKTVIGRLKAMNAPRNDELTGFHNFIEGRSGYQKPGNKHFWKADIMVHHGAAFYLSARVPSLRTTGTEKVSGENLKRKYLPWGATSIMVDGDEYVNIFPAWDWSRIPGVTTVKDDVVREKPEASQSTINTTSSTYFVSSSEFAGGVSDGIFGLAAYDYSWDGIRGRKAWFFTPEAMYCLGSGIEASKSKPVITNVNQCLSSGPVTVNINGVKSSFGEAEMTESNLRWSHHDNVGYLFPSGGKITVKNAGQTGSYSEIGPSRSTAPVTRRIFSMWIDHGNAPSDGRYEYVVVPSGDLNQFEAWLKTNPLRLISNENNYQAVHDKNSGVFGIAFYRAGTVSLEPGLSVLVSRPCLLLIQSVRKGAGYKITVSDPTTKIQNVIVKISKTLRGNGSVINPDQSTSLSIIFPSGDDAGKSLTMEFSNETTTSAGIENFKPGPLPNYY